MSAISNFDLFKVFVPSTSVQNPLLFFLNALIVFGNFPFLILISNKRPMFVDDLFIKDRNEIEFNLTDIEKEKFEKLFFFPFLKNGNTNG